MGLRGEKEELEGGKGKEAEANKEPGRKKSELNWKLNENMDGGSKEAAQVPTDS